MKSICYLSDSLFAERQLIVAQVDALLDTRRIRIKNYSKNSYNVFRDSQQEPFEDSPSITDLIESQHHNIQVVKQRPLLDVLLQNEADGVEQAIQY